MPPATAHEPHAAGASDPGSRLARAIERAAHLLPAQGPITIFVHHNTLHAFEDLPFHDAVREGARVFGCQPYLAEERYREALGRGRIRFDELREVLGGDLGDRAGEPVVAGVSRRSLRLAMLEFPMRTGSPEELLWHVGETGALRRFRREVSAVDRARMVGETRRWVMRDLRRGACAGPGGGDGAGPPLTEGLAALLGRYGEADLENWSDREWEGFTLRLLWRICRDGVAGVPAAAPPPEPVRHRDLLLAAAGVDADVPANDLLTRFTAAYLDQGLAHWSLPRREEGYYRAFLALYRLPGGPPDRWLRGLAVELARLDDAGVGPMESIAESLRDLGVAEAEWDDYLAATLLALRGWGGMVRQTEVRGDRVVSPSPPGSLVGMLAVRLLLDRFALRRAAQAALGYDGPLSGLRAAARRRLRASPPPPNDELRAYAVFQLAQILGVTPEALQKLDPAGWAALLGEIEAFGSTERRRIFHMAYELRFLRQTLDAVSLHAARPPAAVGTGGAAAPPRFQAVFCIDEREESIRRHLEEVAPDAATYGTAGFFSVAMYYRGADDAHFVPLCPPVVRPGHWVAERVDEELEGARRRRARARKALGLISHRLHSGSRSLSPLSVLAPVAGVLATLPLAALTLLPRATARARRALGRFVEAPPRTRLVLERPEGADPGPGPGGLGFTVDEMAAVAEKVLREIGLVDGFSRLVLILGHGSTSQNNPHKSAYDCGACGGAPGGPNARALARFLNDPRVRDRLAGRGVAIPDSTVFVGGLHNTSNDSVTFHDLRDLPASHRADLDAARDDLGRACDRDAHERSRRFRSTPLDLSPAAARLAVEARSEDMAQARPEWGHMTNAICVVGRRAATRGLFLDRRAFLTSYDPTTDDPGLAVLRRILSAVVPVCAGINLEYYFSSVDNAGWGCGTKLPHNIVSLLGVMDGAASDLRTGLPWQMIEFHEPVRLLLVIEVDPEALGGLLARDAVLGRLCRNEWVRLATLHPRTRAVSLYEGGAFRPYAPGASRLPRASSSIDWYRGWRDHLEFAEIGGDARRPAGGGGAA